MKLKSLTIQNIRSFREEKRVDFNDDFTILIGPNAGGKSNILDIFSITIRQFLLRPHGITRENGATGPFFQFHSEDPFRYLQNELAKFYGDSGISRINLEVKISQQDIENIRIIIQNRDLLSENAKSFRGAEGNDLNLEGWDDNTVKADEIIKFRVEENRFIPPADTKEKIFYDYLRGFNKFAILLENEKVRLTSPFVHFPPYRGAPPEGLRMSLASQSRWNFALSHAKATSRQTDSLIPLATFHFSSKHRSLEAGAQSQGYEDAFRAEDEVKKVTETLKALGYDWDLILKDPLQNTYEIILKCNNQHFDISQASSGEKEIINFVFGIFSLNVRNGIVIIDEPELHLHPKWQYLLFDLLVTMHGATNNQFIIATHSPSFITPKTLGKMIRIARTDGASEPTKLDASAVGTPREVLHMINSHNNERLFFADTVVLVEGIQDRIIIEKLLDHYSKERDSSLITEVLEVHGKHNFSKYKNLLDSIKIKNYIISDRDYAEELGDQTIKGFFLTESGKITELLFDKKSLDRKALSAAIQEAIVSRDLEKTKDIWGHIEKRSKKFKSTLSTAEEEIFNRFIKDRYTDGILILSKGEIEDYLPDGYKTLDRTIDLIAKPDFLDLMKTNTNYDELKNICKKILEA